MLSDVKDYYGLARDFGQSGYFETAQSQQTFKELRLAIKEGKLVALSGIVGSGKTTTLGVTSRNGVFSTVTAGVQKDALRRKLLRLFLWDFAVRNPIF